MSQHFLLYETLPIVDSSKPIQCNFCLFCCDWQIWMWIFTCISVSDCCNSSCLGIWITVMRTIIHMGESHDAQEYVFWPFHPLVKLQVCAVWHNDVRRMARAGCEMCCSIHSSLSGVQRYRNRCYLCFIFRWLDFYCQAVYKKQFCLSILPSVLCMSFLKLAFLSLLEMLG